MSVLILKIIVSFLFFNSDKIVLDASLIGFVKKLQGALGITSRSQELEDFKSKFYSKLLIKIIRIFIARNLFRIISEIGFADVPSKRRLLIK